MRIAFDIDGTLTKVPEQLKKVMRNCEYSVVLTGSLNPDSSLDGRVKQLESIGIFKEDYHELMSCKGTTTTEVAKMKGEFCRDNNIDLIFEDTPLYTYWISKISPNTACFLIHEDKYHN